MWSNQRQVWPFFIEKSGLLGEYSGSSQATNRLVGCVNAEPYVTVPYSHFPFPIFMRDLLLGDDRALHVHFLEVMGFFSFGQSKWIRRASFVCLLAVLSGLLVPLTLR